MYYMLSVLLIIKFIKYDTRIIMNYLNEEKQKLHSEERKLK